MTKPDPILVVQPISVLRIGNRVVWTALFCSLVGMSAMLILGQPGLARDLLLGVVVLLSTGVSISSYWPTLLFYKNEMVFKTFFLRRRHAYSDIVSIRKLVALPDFVHSMRPAIVYVCETRNAGLFSFRLDKNTYVQDGLQRVDSVLAARVSVGIEFEEYQRERLRPPELWRMLRDAVGAQSNKDLVKWVLYQLGYMRPEYLPQDYGLYRVAVGLLPIFTLISVFPIMMITTNNPGASWVICFLPSCSVWGFWWR